MTTQQDAEKPGSWGGQRRCWALDERGYPPLGDAERLQDRSALDLERGGQNMQRHCGGKAVGTSRGPRRGGPWAVSGERLLSLDGPPSSAPGPASAFLRCALRLLTHEAVWTDCGQESRQEVRQGCSTNPTNGDGATSLPHSGPRLTWWQGWLGLWDILAATPLLVAFAHKTPAIREEGPPFTGTEIRAPSGRLLNPTWGLCLL